MHWVKAASQSGKKGGINMTSIRRKYQAGALLIALSLLASIATGLFRDVLAAQYSDWSTPVNLGGVINSQLTDFGTAVSKKGLSLYFASGRSSPFGGEDLWVAQRPSENAPWGAPLNLGGVVNSSSNDRSPALSRDGHYLFFASDRPGGSGGLDLWVSWRAHVHDDFAWEAPVNLASVNSPATDAGPSFFENDELGSPQLYLASTRPGGAGGLDIWVSTLTGGSWNTPVLVGELNTTQNDLFPTIRHDGREIIIVSNRAGTIGGNDLWMATRKRVDDPWSAPVNLGPGVNSTSADQAPSLSPDRQTLYFGSSRSGGFGSSDLYFSTRTK
jgi:Tol biopolymer transport system component